ncbi:alveolin domain containing intermediate filament IMC6 [Besnoitia besnoiti]|uniref:Alveolin domain containing intermediate filament IMC6 n=1 Tax=Besnoitia besnoiti TaxID=94643 RepID=A0A2A9MLN9_BESBE|nr:alveolin domain containing intermediate filament IMC6 [Besnoitia besnoiti]PFH36587.1 alveolin domain containing intermediate filament IMC6 [Besnoitia besnoiti]
MAQIDSQSVPPSGFPQTSSPVPGTAPQTAVDGASSPAGMFPPSPGFGGTTPQVSTVPGMTVPGAGGYPAMTMRNWPEHRGGATTAGTWLTHCCQPRATMDSTAGGRNYDQEYGDNMWRWTREGKLQLRCGQPLVPVPVIQEVHRRDKIIEVPQVDVVDAVRPKVYNQGVEHEVPVMQINADREDFDVEQIKYVEKEVVVPIVTGFTHKFVAKWDIREVPRPVVKYVGKQEEIEVEVPQVKFVDKVVEHEVVVDTIEKKVPKIIEVPKYVDEVKYVWKPVEKIVHVERFVPVFDVSLECPAPLIVPYPVQAVKEMPAVMVRKEVPAAALDEQDVDVLSPPGTVRVPEEYIREYHKTAPEGGVATLCGPGGAVLSQEQEAEVQYVTAEQIKEARGSAPSDGSVTDRGVARDSLAESLQEEGLERQGSGRSAPGSEPEVQ